MDCHSFVNQQKDFYQKKLKDMYPGFYEVIRLRNHIEIQLDTVKEAIEYFMDLNLIKEESLIRREKKKAIAHLCALPNTNEGSHIIPRYGHYFLKMFKVDAIYLEFRTGDNIIKTSSNLHKHMELKGKSSIDPPLFTMVPLEWISNNYNTSYGKSVEGFENHMKSIGLITEDNNIIYQNMMLILQPNTKLEASINQIKTEISNGFEHNIINGLDNGHLYWLVHAAWTFNYWGFHQGQIISL